jgi:hypothetical protein
MDYRGKLYQKKASQPSSWDHEKALAEALANRSRFLEMHPKYREFQSDIDQMLEKSGSRSNRMVVLSMLIECKLVEMSHEFKKIKGILSQITN